MVSKRLENITQEHCTFFVLVNKNVSLVAAAMFFHKSVCVCDAVRATMLGVPNSDF